MRDKLNELIAATEARNVALESKAGQSHVDIPHPRTGLARNYDSLAYLGALGTRADALIDLVPDAAPAYTWDPATKTALVDLSNSNLTAATTSGDGGYVRSDVAHSTGNKAVRIVADYTQTPDWQEVIVALVVATWNPSVDGEPPHGDAPGGNGFIVTPDGKIIYYLSGTMTGYGNVASGAGRILLVRFDDGEAWVATDDNIDAVAADAESRTSPHYTFTPNLELCVGLQLYSGDGAAVASGTIDPFSVGSFTSW